MSTDNSDYKPHADIPPGVAESFYVNTKQSMARRSDDTDLAMARARDSSLFQMTALNAMTAKELLVSDDISETVRAKLADMFPQQNVGGKPS